MITQKTLSFIYEQVLPTKKQSKQTTHIRLGLEHILEISQMIKSQTCFKDTCETESPDLSKSVVSKMGAM